MEMENSKQTKILNIFNVDYSFYLLPIFLCTQYPSLTNTLLLIVIQGDYDKSYGRINTLTIGGIKYIPLYIKLTWCCFSMYNVISSPSTSSLSPLSSCIFILELLFSLSANVLGTKCIYQSPFITLSCILSLVDIMIFSYKTLFTSLFSYTLILILVHTSLSPDDYLKSIPRLHTKKDLHGVLFLFIIGYYLPYNTL